jgi:hypothetical protein
MKRYSLYINEEAPELTHLEEDEGGEWVRYEDVEEVLRRLRGMAESNNDGVSYDIANDALGGA